MLLPPHLEVRDGMLYVNTLFQVTNYRSICTWLFLSSFESIEAKKCHGDAF